MVIVFTISTMNGKMRFIDGMFRLGIVDDVNDFSNFNNYWHIFQNVYLCLINLNIATQEYTLLDIAGKER